MKPNDWPPPPKNNTLGGWLERACLRLATVSDSPKLEAQMAAAHVLNKPRTWLLAHPETMLAETDSIRLEQLLAGLISGQPFAYLTGEREFYGRQFIVKPGLLVPRPETELLVEIALDWLKKNPDNRFAFDVGCGTGCIAVTLAAEISDLHMEAIDIEPLAIETTSRNADRHGVSGRVSAVTGDLFSITHNVYNLICANLPYIPTGTLNDLPAARHEPVLALDGGVDGLRLIERLLEQASNHIKPGGLILLEIEASQGETAPQLANRFFPTAEIHLYHDLAGLSRLVSIQTSHM